MNPVRILIVEDEFFIAHTLQSKLIELGYQVCGVTASGEEALQKAEAERPDLILIDMWLEGDLDGTQTADQIHSRLKIPILFLTSNADTAIPKPTRRTEPAGYLVKPFSDRELHTNIQMALYKTNVEAQLKASEERFRLLVEFTYDWEYWIDPQGKLICISPACERITGYRPEDFQRDPKLFFSIVYPEDRPRVKEHRGCNSQEPPQFDMEYRIEMKSGERRWIHHGCQSVISPTGKWLGRRICNRDITEHKQIEEEHWKLMDELMKAMEKIRILSGLLPVCPYCKKVRTHQGYWKQIERYVREQFPTEITQNVCPECARKIYPDLYKSSLAAGTLKKNVG